jgi:hypothetical protein
MTSYQYASNNPSSKKDIDGLEGVFFFEETGVNFEPTVESVAKAGGDIAKAGDEVSKNTANQNRAANTSRGNQTETEQLKNNGLQKNTESIRQVDPKTGKEGETIPDALKNNGKSSVEIKDVKQQSLTKQLRLQEAFSKGNGLKPELIINEGAKLSKPLTNSTFDIKTYEVAPVVLKTDATKTVPSNIQPASKPSLREKYPDII